MHKNREVTPIKSFDADPKFSDAEDYWINWYRTLNTFLTTVKAINPNYWVTNQFLCLLTFVNVSEVTTLEEAMYIRRRHCNRRKGKISRHILSLLCSRTFRVATNFWHI